MKRVSNLAFNREFPKLSGLTKIPANNVIKIKRDLENRFDDEAVGVFMDGIDTVVGWLFKKDNNRPKVLGKLLQVPFINGKIELQKNKKVVVYWL